MIPREVGPDYLFGDFRLDTVRQVLITGSVQTPMPERLFRILLLLLEARGGIVERQALSTLISRKEGISDANLTQSIYLLRMLLGERRRGRSYIATVPARGYRFVAPLAIVSHTDKGRSSCGEETNPFRLYCTTLDLDRHAASSLQTALASFQAALRKNPTCQPALVGLTRAEALLAKCRRLPAHEAFPHSRAAAARALEFEPGLPVAQAILSEILLFTVWTARQEFRPLDAD
jgi:DNA-binding winged helix-turn-helix (wHTH) protein